MAIVGRFELQIVLQVFVVEVVVRSIMNYEAVLTPIFVAKGQTAFRTLEWGLYGQHFKKFGFEMG